jgi:hypothetical protein
VLFIFQSPYCFTIGHRGVFSLGRWSAQLRTEFHELRATLVHLSSGLLPFAYGTITRYGSAFQKHSAGKKYPSRCPQPRDESRFGLVPISLAATHGIDVSFFSCRYLDVSVPCVRSTCPMRSGRSDGGLLRRVSAFRNLRINARLPAPRSFSQAAASFVASRCQDIHRTPLRVWPHLSITVNYVNKLSVVSC